MIPRCTRALLLLSMVSSLVVTTTPATAQLEEAGEIAGAMLFGDAETCAQGTTHGAPVTISHERCIGGSFREGFLVLVATRGVEALDGRDPRVAWCVSADPSATLPFATRENTLEGRGRIGPVHQDLGTGTVVDPHAGLASTGPCRLRMEGAFHRMGKVTVGRFLLDLHVDVPDFDRQFRHIYCARFELSDVPTRGFSGFEMLITATFGGRQCDADEEHDVRLDPPLPPRVDFHGRTPFDDIDPLHHDECNAPPSELLGERGLTCFAGLTH